MRWIKYPEERRCYDCGSMGDGFIIGDTQDLPLRFICIDCINKMNKKITERSLMCNK